MEYDPPITSREHALWCLQEAERRYAGKIEVNEDRFFVVVDTDDIRHTDEVLRAVSIYAIDHDEINLLFEPPGAQFAVEVRHPGTAAPHYYGPFNTRSEAFVWNLQFAEPHRSVVLCLFPPAERTEDEKTFDA